MKLRKKILIYFSGTIVTLVGVALLLVYQLFAAYREEEFQQRQKEKARFTVRLLAEYQEMSETLSQIMDQLAINDFYDEKLLIYDSHKDRVYASVDSLPIANHRQILNELSANNRWIETKDGDYDLIGTYVESNGTHYYAISKAYDKFGYTKLVFLRHTLLVLFVIITIAVVLVTLFISRRITRPITQLAEKLAGFRAGEPLSPATPVKTDTFELNFLNEKIDELHTRTNEAFSFQRHTVQHISHELKTPIAILVSELERIQAADTGDRLRNDLTHAIEKAQSLGVIIDTLLQLSRLESNKVSGLETFRADELLFDLIADLSNLHPDFQFEVNYQPHAPLEERLEVSANKMLLRQALLNLLTNAIAYAPDHSAEVILDVTAAQALRIRISNKGAISNSDEAQYLFDHFFRGENSKGTTGFGLGLVLAKKIMDLHEGSISYNQPWPGQHVFELSLLKKTNKTRVSYIARGSSKAGRKSI